MTIEETILSDDEMIDRTSVFPLALINGGITSFAKVLSKSIKRNVL